jgi:hypothetical protein
VTNLSRYCPNLRAHEHYTELPAEVKFSFYRRSGDIAQEQFNGKALIRADFQRNDASRRQQMCQAGNDLSVGGQAIFAAIKRKERIVIANLWRKTGEFGFRDIWRIGNDHIKTAAQGMGPIAAYNARTLLKPESRAIFVRNHAGFVRPIDADAGRAGEALQ